MCSSWLDSLPGIAKDKKKILLPDDVLQARTALVAVDPEDGISLEHPNDNPIARQDVEKAIMLWGRFTLVMDARSADLIIVVHRGTGKVVAPIVRGGPVDDRPIIAESTGDAAVSRPESAFNMVQDRRI